MSPDMFPLCPIIREGYNEFLIYESPIKRVWRSKKQADLFYIDWLKRDLIEAVKVKDVRVPTCHGRPY